MVSLFTTPVILTVVAAGEEPRFAAYPRMGVNGLAAAVSVTKPMDGRLSS